MLFLNLCNYCRQHVYRTSFRNSIYWTINVHTYALMRKRKITWSLDKSSFHWLWYFWNSNIRRLCRSSAKSGGNSFKMSFSVKLFCTLFRISERRHAKTYGQNVTNHSWVKITLAQIFFYQWISQLYWNKKYTERIHMPKNGQRSIKQGRKQKITIPQRITKRKTKN